MVFFDAAMFSENSKSICPAGQKCDSFLDAHVVVLTDAVIVRI